MTGRFILIISMIISWLSAFILRIEKIKKYMPVAFFASFLVTIVYLVAYHRRWWKLEKPTIPWLKSIELTYILGPFFVGTIWVFSLTYKFGFRVYLISNLILDGFFSYIIMPFLESMGIITLKGINRTGIYGLMTSIALIIYPFQRWQDGKVKKRVRLFKSFYKKYT